MGVIFNKSELRNVQIFCFVVTDETDMFSDFRVKFHKAYLMQPLSIYLYWTYFPKVSGWEFGKLNFPKTYLPCPFMKKIDNISMKLSSSN